MTLSPPKLPVLAPDIHADFDVNARVVKVTVKPALELSPIVILFPFWYVRHMANQINAYDVKVEQEAKKPSPILRAQ